MTRKTNAEKALEAINRRLANTAFGRMSTTPVAHQCAGFAACAHGCALGRRMAL